MKFEIFTPTVIHELGNRSSQEDSVFPALGAAADTDRLFLVCDGMGGHARGEVASANVIDAMTEWIGQRTPPSGIVTDGNIEDALQSAHQRLDSLDDGAENKMGTTLVLVCLHRGGVLMGHVGDSRIYHIRPSQHKILYKSIDHSLVYDLYRNGVISYEEMATSPQRNVITRAIMPGEENNDKIDITHTTDVLPGDYFYLCSDGMLEQMTDEELLDVLCDHSTDVMKADALRSRTKDNKDNHTALLIKIKNVIVEPGDENLQADENCSPYNEVAAHTVDAVNAGPRTSPIVAMSDEDAVASQPGRGKAPAPAANNSITHSTKSCGRKKGVNKLLLLLVIFLLALVTGAVVYYLLNKNSGDNDYDDDNVSQAIEKNDSTKHGRDASKVADDERASVNAPIEYPRRNNSNNSTTQKKVKAKPVKDRADDGDRQIIPDNPPPTDTKTEEKNPQKDNKLKDLLKPKNRQNQSQKLEDNIVRPRPNKQPPQNETHPQPRENERVE